MRKNTAVQAQALSQEDMLASMQKMIDSTILMIAAIAQYANADTSYSPHIQEIMHYSSQLINYSDEFIAYSAKMIEDIDSMENTNRSK